MSKDYYKILGVREDETFENIKTAYRRLARKWHPDVAGNDSDIIARFKEITEAYETLSNKVKREEYDRARRFYAYARGEANNYRSNNYTQNPSSKENASAKNYKDVKKKSAFSFDWEDFILKKKFENSFKKEEKPLPQKGKDVYAEVEISLFEAIEGVEKTINMVQSGACPKCGGRKFINGSICKHCMGSGEYSVHKKFTVKIPAGVKNNSKIRLSGEGSEGVNGGINGDLYIKIKVKEPVNYTTEGLNILKTVAISPYEAVLGTEIEIKTINGNYSIKIPAKTQNGQKIRLSGCGMMQNENIGDMIISIEIKIPNNISDEEIKLYKMLQSLASGNVRDNIND